MIKELTEQEMILHAQIAELQDLVINGPAREQKAAEERMRTMPPPKEIEERKREKILNDRITRGELINERRKQASNGLLLILLICAIFATGSWIYNVIFP